ncbi:hypothetical protein [Agromyces mariniharenae]|uniref:Uncharacterized protein n=1 Tax=Agromyces mariniharenae TaxID=2604423 RepID=A0A5S4UY42_9MICO|nr:hypothetical protein [Agromyces mariniharenae]TYL51038.1 hypothetical protein FYC51_18070 [Agromyces mariniharenae]
MPATSPTPDRAARARARRAADLADREAATLDVLEWILPAYAAHRIRRIAFSALWKDLQTVPGILGRDGLYRLLSTLDGARLDGDLIVRIADHERTARRSLVLRRRLTAWEDQRPYLRDFRFRGGHPPRPISYRAAHARVRAERGPASAQWCDGCGERAEEWAYTGSSLDEQVGPPYRGAEDFALWSPYPADYAPMCRRCHHELDASGVLWGDAPLPPRRPVGPVVDFAELPADAPAWLRAMAPEAADR